MMNAEAIAEKRPAWQLSEQVFNEISHGTHEDQGGIQIFVILLEKFLVILFGHFAVVLVELGLKVLLNP